RGGRQHRPAAGERGSFAGRRHGEVGAFMSVTSRIRARRRRESGLTLVELIVTIAILSILASAALPVARFEYKRQKERELRRDLWLMRDAIDHYKDAADRGAFQI